MIKLWTILALMFAAGANAQVKNPSILFVSTAPSGSCMEGAIPQLVVSTGLVYTCQNGTWGSIGGGGGGTGTVTSVSGLTPLFTVNTPTTTPTFSLSPAAANSVFGNFTGSSSAPVFSATPTFSGANLTALNATQLTTGTVPAGRLPLASASAFGAVECGSGTTCTAGVISTSGGSGNTTSTALTSGTFPVANGANSIVNSLATDNGTTFTYSGTGGLSAPSITGTGSGAQITATETTPPTAVSGGDILQAISANHRFQMFLNGGAALNIPGIATAGTAGHLVQLASNGIDLVDAAAGSSPTCVAGAGAGTGATCSVTGTNISHVVTVNTGTSPTASAVVVTVTYSVTLGSAPVGRSIAPRNELAVSNMGAVIPSAPTTTNYEINGSAVMLPASTTGITWSLICI